MKPPCYVYALITVLGLAGCAAPEVRPASSATFSTDLKAGEAQEWSAWQARGRLAVKTAKDGFNAHFNWRQAGDATELVVEGPFGAGHSRIVASPERIRIEAGSQPPLEFSAPFEGAQAALAERVGFALPLGSLACWIRGLPDPAVGIEGVVQVPVGMTAGGFGAFDQAGWHIQPDDPVGVAGRSATLPRRVTLTQGEVRIRVVVDQWSAEP